MSEKIKFGEYEFSWMGDEYDDPELSIELEPQPSAHFSDGQVEYDSGSYILLSGKEVLLKLRDLLNEKLR